MKQAQRRESWNNSCSAKSDGRNVGVWGWHADWESFWFRVWVDNKRHNTFTVSDFQIFNWTTWVQESTLDRTWIQYVDRVESVVSCHERFEFEDEWDIGCVHLFEWLRSESTAKAVAAICRSFTADWSNEKWNVLDASKLASHGRGKSSVNKLAQFSVKHNARGWNYVIRRGRTNYRLHRGLQDNERVRVRWTGTATASSRTRYMYWNWKRGDKEILSNSHTHCGAVCGKDADDLHRRQQDSDLKDALLDRIDPAAEAGMDKVLVNHNNGAVAVTTPKKSLSARPESVAIG